MPDALFIFELQAVERRDDPYYVTNWDKAKPITVVAETQQQAIDKADSALGKVGSNHHWVFRLIRAEDFLLKGQTVDG